MKPFGTPLILNTMNWIPSIILSDCILYYRFSAIVWNDADACRCWWTCDALTAQLFCLHSYGWGLL